MSLIKCPECKTQMSDMAPVCPKCGFARTPAIGQHLAHLVRKHQVGLFVFGGEICKD